MVWSLPLAGDSEGPTLISATTSWRTSALLFNANIFFALGVKAVFMTLAIFQAATLWMAIAAGMGTSLLVVFNALTLLKYRGVGAGSGSAKP